MYKIRVDSNGNILTQYRSPELNPQHGDTVAGYLWLEDTSFRDVHTSWWNGEGWEARQGPPTKWHLWVSGAWVESEDKKAVIVGQTMANVRILRNSLLASCDWTQVSDSPLTDSKKAEWVTYRQSLRDAITTPVTDIADFEWPTPPSE